MKIDTKPETRRLPGQKRPENDLKWPLGGVFDRFLTFFAFLTLLLMLLPAQATETVRIMTFNLRYASASEDQDSWKQWDSPDYIPQRRQFVAHILTNLMPDVIGFQEGEDSQIDDLAAMLPALYDFELQLPSGGQSMENAAIAWNTNKLEMLDRGVMSLGPSPGGGWWNNPPGTNYMPYLFFPNMGLGFPRISLWGRFRWRATGQEFLFHTTHFDFNNDPQVGSARLITDNTLSRAGRSPLSPLGIVVGDFNSTQANNDWALFTGAYTNGGITGDFTDSWQQVHGAWTDSGTMHGYGGGTQAESVRIDWILHRGGLLATQCVIVTDSTLSTNQTTSGVSTLYPSDHYPVFADLVFPSLLPDFDGEGLSDASELALGLTNPADADSDGDGLLDGLEDLNGNGIVDGGETDPTTFNVGAQLPTDIRNAQIDGILDYQAELAAENNGMTLHTRFDGRYLTVATWDAGEGQDHFIFLVTNPTDAVAAPWAKAGQVARWSAYLVDENDSDYQSWYDASGSQITNTSLARSAAYFENGGRIEGVIDMAQLFGAGFTQPVYLAVAPYLSADGGGLQSAYQVPAGNGDGDLLGVSEFFQLTPGDIDSDGLNDDSDPDADGDGMPDAWEKFHFGSTGTAPSGDEDGDGASNLDEWRSFSDPMNSNSVFRIDTAVHSATGLSLSWTVPYGKSSTIYRASTASFSNGMTWTAAQTYAAPATFPAGTNIYSAGLDATSRYFRLGVVPR